MTTPNQDDIATRVAALTEEFPGYEFTWTANDDTTDKRYHISAQETGSWSAGEVKSATGDTIEGAIDQMRSTMRSGQS